MSIVIASLIRFTQASFKNAESLCFLLPLKNIQIKITFLLIVIQTILKLSAETSKNKTILNTNRYIIKLERSIYCNSRGALYRIY